MASDVYEDQVWSAAFSEVKEQFNVSDLFKEQEEAIRSFFSGYNVFVNLPTGFGKSLIFQCLPIVADVLNGRQRGSSVLIVISPLKSLMGDQVSSLENIGIPAVAVSDITDPEIIQQVYNGIYPIIFVSPECLLATSTWRGIFNADDFKEKLIGVVVDEAHCITQWGLHEEKKGPFRKWYGCLGELSSLTPKECRIMILTATATTTTKQQIIGSLNLSNRSVKFIEYSPDRPNLFYTTEYLDKNQPLVEVFGNLMHELEIQGKNTTRTIIYCQTRKQCSLLFTMCEMYLGRKMFNGDAVPQNRLVEMYHAGTPASVKSHVSVNMAKNDGHLRVLISTNAFGMGVNCKSVHRIIHFGPSKTIEMYVQECGRAGRDGEPSLCILLYNGLLSANCDTDVKRYVQAQGCLRKILMEHFSQTETATNSVAHTCCKGCHSSCKCGNCPDWWTVQCKEVTFADSYFDSGPREHCTRAVTNEQHQILKLKLQRFQQSLKSTIDVHFMVSCPNLILEFNKFHANQVLNNCQFLFTLQDVYKFVEIWRTHYAVNILRMIKETFHDVDIDLPTLADDLDETQFSEWGDIRDDSSLVDFFDSQDLTAAASTIDSMDTSCDLSN